MTYELGMTVNGVPSSATVEGRMLLVQYLREHLGLTGTHVGCDTSQCGACTVHLNGDAVKSCTILALQAHGQRVDTIEAPSEGEDLDAVQRAFSDEHALQCGYCTPGFIMATRDLLGRNPNPSDEEIRAGLDGNLCRCTGYVNIIKAVRAAAASLADDGGRS